MTIHLYCIPFIKVSVYKTESILQQHCMVLKVYWHTVTQTAINWSLMQKFLTILSGRCQEFVLIIQFNSIRRFESWKLDLKSWKLLKRIFKLHKIYQEQFIFFNNAENYQGWHMTHKNWLLCWTSLWFIFMVRFNDYVLESTGLRLQCGLVGQRKTKLLIRVCYKIIWAM